MIGLLLASLMLQADRPDRTYEGDWYVSDDTDNNTGQRKVSAFQTYIEDKDFVRLDMRCIDGKPVFFVDWDDLPFPEQAVLTLIPLNDDVDSPPQRYVFEKSKDIVDRGMRASPDTSAQIVRAIGGAKSLGVRAHLTSGDRYVIIGTDGTQRAWSRVARHCPIRVMPRPPL